MNIQLQCEDKINLKVDKKKQFFCSEDSFNVSLLEPS